MNDRSQSFVYFLVLMVSLIFNTTSIKMRINNTHAELRQLRLAVEQYQGEGK